MSEPHTPWTDEERAMLRRLRQNGVSIRDAAVMMGRSFHSVHRQVRYLGLNLPPNAKRQKPEAQRAGRTTLPPLPSLRDA